MIGNRQKVKPQQLHNNHPQKYSDYDRGWSSSDNETISAFTYAFRKVRKSDISRLCDQEETEFIEKRFEDTSKIIFKELEQLNLPLLRRSYRRPLRSDVVSIAGKRVTSPPTAEAPIKGNRSSNGKSSGQPEVVVPTMDTIWQGPPATVRSTSSSVPPSKPVTNADNLVKPPGNRNSLGKNTVAPETVQVEGRLRRRRPGGICRVT